MERRATDTRRAPKRRAPRTRPAQADSVTALRAVVETVRRVMRADTASVARISQADRTITWAARSGFRAAAEPAADEVVLPLRGMMAESAAAAEGLLVLAGIGARAELPAEEFPLHAAEGVRDVALVPLNARGARLGVLVVGYRAAHEFTADERQTLEGLAEMAALALDNARLVETVGASKRVWEQTFDAIPDGIIVHDAHLRVTRCNATAADALALDAPAAAIGLSCADVFARLFGERAAAFHMSRAPGAATSFEIQAEDGRRYLVAVAPLEEFDGRTGWSVITWSDVTELSEVQEQLARSRRLATTGQLAAGVAHEINNPLAAVTTCAEAALRDLRQAPAEVRAFAAERNWSFYLEEIVRQALRCKAITRGLLDLARQRRARRAPCELNALVERAALVHAQRAAERGVTLATELDAAVGEVATDEAMVRQVLDNLLTNALDAAGAGGRVVVKTAAHGPRVAVEVADTGPGIAPELLTRIFEPFYTTKEAGQGSGLGLAISTTLAEALGGALTVESKRGAGSCFRLWLPLRTPEAEER
ncbi:MAG TPA: ATP-binding protein [Pyrinomonadaceae bacterium]|jgi:two-component system NtrC family sensor kinase